MGVRDVDEVGEIIKSDAMGHAADLLKKLAGPLFEEVGAIMGDSVRVYRLKNLVRVAQKTKRILDTAGLPTNPIPGRLLLPIMEAASVEEDEDLQALWAGLLASASNQNKDFSPSFVHTLKQLSPSEAAHLERLQSALKRRYKRHVSEHDFIAPHDLTISGGAPESACETYERLGLIRRDYNVKIPVQLTTHLSSSRGIEGTVADLENTLGAIEDALDSLEPEVGYAYLFTKYAANFFIACDGPDCPVEKK